jgi:GAF domain-containing protein
MEQEKIIIYIADDDEDVLRTQMESWEDTPGFLPCGFSSVVKLLDALKSPAPLPVALLMDFVMDGGGELLLKDLRKQYPELPIIVYSGLDTYGSIRAYTMGAYSVMQKPLDFNELRVIVKELADQQEMFKRLVRDMLDITGFDTCLVWQFDKPCKNYRIVGWSADIDRGFVKKTSMDELRYPRILDLKAGQVQFVEDVTAVTDKTIYAEPEEARKRGWVSLLAVPLLKDDRLIGWIDCYKKQRLDGLPPWGGPLVFTDFLRRYAVHATQALHSATVTQQLRILHEINQNLASTLHNELIFKNILGKVIEVTGAECGWIYEYDNKEHLLRLGKCEGFREELADRIRPLDNGGITGMVAKRGESLNVPDISVESEGYTPSMHISIPPEMPVRSVLSVPLRRRERTLGVLTVKSTQVDFFSKDDTLLAFSLASIGAICMDRAKLTKHLGEISRRAQDGSNFKDLAQYIVDAVHDLTEADVNLWMMSREEGEGDDWMRIRSTSRHDGDKDYKAYEKTAKAPTTLGKSLIAEALHTNAPVVIPDLSKHNDDPPFYNKQYIEKFAWRSFLVVPMIGKKGEFLGAISLASRVVNNFTQDDEGRLIQHFADQATLAIQEQKHITVLQELTEVGQDLTLGLPGMRELNRKVATMARKISEANLTVLYPYDIEQRKYFDKSHYVFDGTLKGTNELMGNPRPDGLAALIRQHGMLIVEDVKDEKAHIVFGSERLPDSDPRHQMARAYIRDSQFIARENIESFIGISLRTAEQAAPEQGSGERQQEVAVLYVNFRAPRNFSEQYLQVLGIFSSQVANIMHRNRLFAELAKKSKVLNDVFNSTSQILASQGENNRLQRVVEEAVALLGGGGGTIYLVENSGLKNLELMASVGISDENLLAYRSLGGGLGAAGEVVKSGEPIIIDDYQTYENRIEHLVGSFKAVVEVPLLIGPSAIGVLGVFSNDRSFTQQDVDTLRRLAEQAALAIYNSQLYTELDAIYQTGVQMVSQADMKDMADRVLKELKRVIQYDRATFQLVKNHAEQRVLLAKEGYPNEMAVPALFKPIEEDRLLRPIVEGRKPVVLADTFKSPDWDSNIPETGAIRSWVCLPLVFRGDVLGLIMLDSLTPDFYHDRDRDRLERFATFAAAALYNASVGQLHLDVLSQFSDRVSNLKDTDTKEGILEEAMVLIDKVFDPIACCYYFTDKNYVDIAKLRAFGQWVSLKSEHLQPGQGLAGWVAVEKTAKLYPDDFPEEIRDESGHQPGNSLIFAPFWRVGEVIGVIEIETRETDQDRNRKNFLATMITQVSLAMQQIEQRARRAENIEKGFNPYIVGGPIRNPKEFFGRKDILQEILTGIQNNNYAVVDERRIGKTSLLLRIKHELEGATEQSDIVYCPVYMTLQGIGEDRFYALLIDKIREALLMNGEIETTGYGFDDFQRDFRKIRQKLRDDEMYSSTLIVLLVDEISQLDSYAPVVQDRLRALLVEENLLRIVMAGFHINLNPESITSPWYNFLNIRKLGPFTASDAIDLIIAPVKDNYVFQEAAIQRIVAHSDKKPYFIQNLCYAAVSRMLRRIKSPDSQTREPVVLEEDVEYAILNTKLEQP